jgi:hypothetical protein
MLDKYKFGIELETTFLEDDYVDASNTTLALGLDWGADGSLNADEEFDTVEIRTEGGHTQEALTELVNRFDKEVVQPFTFRTNSSCGFHLHTSHPQFMQNMYIKKLIYFWASIEDILVATQPSTRNDTYYCRRRLRKFIDDNEYELPEGKDDLETDLSKEQDRYFTLNLCALTKYKTIEVRLHSGTINKTKILNWVVLMKAIYEYVANHYDHNEVEMLFNAQIDEKKIDKFFELIEASSSLKKFYKNRILKFKGLPQLGVYQQDACNKVKSRLDLVKLERKFNEKPTIRALTELRAIYSQNINSLA